jgi:hypothetical protein
MMNRLGVCLLVLISACAVEADTDGEVEQALAGSAAEAAQPADPGPAVCKPAEAYDAGKLAVRSCLAGVPINVSGLLAEPTTGAASTQSCATYYGSCSGGNGCSRAVGGGWQFTACGSFLFAWMTICDGQPTGWGTGFCLF